MTELSRGKSEAAWTAFLDRYRRLLFATIRHYSHDYDTVMDLFARVCEALREDDLKRMRAYLDNPAKKARFSTWLVAVVRNLAIDWFRQRDGRRRLSALALQLSPLHRRIFELVFLDGRRHVETYELLRMESAEALPFRMFLTELRQLYATVAEWRGGQLLRDLGGPQSEPSDDASSAHEHVERRVMLDNALKSLEPGERAAVELYVVEEIPAADVARMLGLASVKAVYNKVYRALSSLREQLEAAGVRKGDL